MHNNNDVQQYNKISKTKPGRTESGFRRKSSFPPNQKLRVQDTRIWDIRRSRPGHSAMEGPHPGGTAL